MRRELSLANVSVGGINSDVRRSAWAMRICLTVHGTPLSLRLLAFQVLRRGSRRGLLS